MSFRRMLVVGLWVFVLCGSCLLGWAGAGGPDGTAEHQFVCLDSTHVVVRTLTTPVPSDSSALNSFLWDRFINGPDSEGFDCLVWDCEKIVPSYVRALIRKAMAESLPGGSIAKCLSTVLADRGRNAYLPVSATYGTFGKEAVWIILVRWEWADSSSREILGHARVYVVDARHAQIVAFATCD